MNRPRITGIVSGIAASVAAFLVVSRWELAGTLTGAAIMPVVYTLVSHCSVESLDGLGKWARRRVGREPVAERAAEEPKVSPAPPAIKRRAWSQWALVGMSVLALGVSIWSVALRAPVERVLVREKVVEKTVTVTTDAADTGATKPVGGDGGSATTTTSDPGTSTTTSEQTGTEQTGDTGQDGTGGSSPPTTVPGASPGETTAPPAAETEAQNITP
jgi:hypothetical protein